MVVVSFGTHFLKGGFERQGGTVSAWDLTSLTRAGEGAAESPLCGPLQGTSLSEDPLLTPANPPPQSRISFFSMSLNTYSTATILGMMLFVSSSSDLTVCCLQTSLEEDSCQENQIRSKQKNKIHRTQMGKDITESTEWLAWVSVDLLCMLLIQCAQVILAQNHKPLPQRGWPQIAQQST